MKSGLRVSLSLILMLLALVVWLPNGSSTHADAGYTIQWASAQSGNWNDASKWDLNRVPVASDRVLIGVTGSYTVTLDTNATDATVTGLTLEAPQATFATASGTTLTITGTDSVFNHNNGYTRLNGNLELTGPGTTCNMNGGELDINAGLYMSNGTFNYNGGTLPGIPTLVLDNSTLNLGASGLSPASFQALGSCTISGDIKADQSVLVTDGTDSNASLTAGQGFTNYGTLTLETTGGNHDISLNVLAGTLVNTGALNITTGTGGGRTINASLTNNGTVVINAGTDFIKPQATYINNGTFTLATGKTLHFTGANSSFNQDSGETKLNGDTYYVGTDSVFNMTGGELDINAGFYLSGSTFSYSGGYLDRTSGGLPTLILEDSRLVLWPSGLSAAVFRMLGLCTISGDIKTTQTVLVNDGSAGDTSLTAEEGFTNHGTLTLETINGSHDISLIVTGILMNEGTLSINTGSGGGRIINADLTNNGMVSINADTDFIKPQAIYINNGAFTVAISKTLRIMGNGSVFHQNGGLTKLNGNLEMVASDITFNMNDGTLDINAGFEMSRGIFTYTKGILPGTPTLILDSSTLNLELLGTSPAVFRMYGSGQLGGEIKVGQSVLVNGGYNGSGSASLTVPGGFTNRGILTLETVSGNNDSSLNAGGLVLNKGTLNIYAGSGGGRLIDADMTNNGTVNFNTDTNLVKPGTTCINNGTMNLRNASIIITDSSSTLTNSDSGVVFGAGTISISGGIFRNNGLVRPGYHVGTLNVIGNYDQSSTGTVDVQIAGLLADTGYDVVGVSDSVTLAGILNVSTIFGFTPTFGDTFRIVTSGILTNAFETVNFPVISDGLGWDISYQDNAVTLSVIYAAIPEVHAGPDAIIDEGSTFSSSGSFDDPGDDIWTATVDYGDSTGIQPLSLNPDKTFSLEHTYTDDGSYTVTVSVGDDDGTGTDTVLVTVNSVSPVVNAGEDDTIEEGSDFTSSGSFEDPGDDIWTATVDYGDSTGIQPLALNPDKTFALEHIYADDGSYTVTVSVSDDDGGVGTDTVTVTVTSVEPTIIQVEIDVKPGNSANKINYKKEGSIWVAVLTDAEFDAALIDTDTVVFGPAGATPERFKYKDADHDGDIDMVFRFKVSETGLQIGDTDVTLHGTTTGGQDFEGTDSVEVVPQKDKDKDKGKRGDDKDNGKGTDKGKGKQGVDKDKSKGKK